MLLQIISMFVQLFKSKSVLLQNYTCVFLYYNIFKVSHILRKWTEYYSEDRSARCHIFLHNQPIWADSVNRVWRCARCLVFHLTNVSLSGCWRESADTVWFGHLLAVLRVPGLFIHWLSWLEWICGMQRGASALTSAVNILHPVQRGEDGSEGYEKNKRQITK